MTAKTAPKTRKPKQTIAQKAALEKAWERGFDVGLKYGGRKLPSDMLMTGVVVRPAIEPEAEVRDSWLHRLWKKVRG